MKIKSIHISAFLVLVLLITFGCGAKEPSTWHKYGRYEEIPLGPEEAVAVLLINYDHNDLRSDDKAEQKAIKARKEKKFEKCIESVAVNRNPPIKMLSIELVKKNLFADVDFSSEVNENDILQRLSSQEVSKRAYELGLSFLGIMDIKTTEIDMSESPSGDFTVISEDIKSTYAKTYVYDLLRGRFVDRVDLHSTGKEGYTAGVAAGRFAIVPFYFPYWAFTEDEVCGSIGKHIFDIFSVKELAKDSLSKMTANSDRTRTTYKCIGDRIPVKVEPSVNSKQFDLLYFGQSVQVHGITEDGWYQVENMDKKTGYVEKKWLEKVNTDSPSVDEDSKNFTYGFGDNQ
jgi:ribosomal protein L21E